ncbi:MAG TPA: OmpA family protein, partial [Kofleriaceae bacterium]|nr:OmpA family protein [Kofleriaceae bacterium]
PDGQSVAIGGGDTTIRLLSVDSGGELRRFGGQLERFTAVAACGPGTLASGSDRGIRLWDLAGGTGSRLLAAGAVDPRMLSCSADGGRIAAATPAGVQVWQRDGAALGKQAAGAAPIAAARLAPAGDRIALLYTDGTLTLSLVDGGRALWHRKIHNSLGDLLPVYSADGTVNDRSRGALAFSADGALLASTGTDGTVKLWDVATGQKRQLLLAAGADCGSVVFSGDAVLGSGQGSIWRWQVGKPGLGRSLALDGGTLAVAPDARTFAAAGGADLSVGDGGTSAALGKASSDGPIVDLAYGDVIATIQIDRTLRLWSPRAALPLAVIVGGPGNDWLAIGADGHVDGSPGAQGARALLTWQRGDAQLPGFTAWDRQHVPGLLAHLTGKAGAVLVARAPGPPAGAERRGRVVVTDTNIEILDRLLFASGSPALDANDEVIADAIAGTLTGNPQILLVELQGHADDTEGGKADPAALELSRKRAEAVRAYLIADGIDPNRLTAQGYGSTQPIDRHHTAAARAKNRRVDSLILKRGTD